MIAKATYHPRMTFFVCRIYRILLAVLINIILWNELFPQDVGAYKTVQSGNYSNLSTWNIFNGTTWSAPVSKPNSSNDIYIDQTHTLKLVANESAKNVFINAETGAGQKLNLNGFSLNIYGSLNAFSGSAPGSPDGTWNSQNWIGNSTSSKIVFKGSSRTIIPKGAWSGFSTNSRYAVEFDPGPGVQLTVEEPFKASKFTIKSGEVIQSLDTSTLPYSCPTFSFNTETSNGLGAYGDFVIESGGTFTSNCNDGIIFRSGSTGTQKSASLFEIKDGGTLILEGTTPLIEAETFQLNGKIIYSNNTNNQIFLSSSYIGSSNPNTVHDLEIQGSKDLVFPLSLKVSGDITKTGSGNFLMSTSSIEFTGTEDQYVTGFQMIPGDLTLNKADGSVILDDDLSVLDDLTMTSGSLDLQGNNLSINTSLVGSYSYSGGSWKNINQFTYYGSPLILTSTNATFPYEDIYNGGIRKVQFQGISTGGNLQISYTEYPGAEYNSSFSDSDGTPILYRLFSYFQFSGFNFSVTSLELRISADQLIVDQADDLRIVGTGYAAPGSHLPGLNTDLWARRSISINDLEGVNFTVGSYRTLSILPLKWLKTSATYENGTPKIQWELSGASENSTISIYRFSSLQKGKTLIDSIEFQNSNPSEFYDFTTLPPGDIFYQLKYSDDSGSEYWSSAFSLDRKEFEKIRIFPNPIQGSEEVFLSLSLKEINSPLIITDMVGRIVAKGLYEGYDISKIISPLPPGQYTLTIQLQDQAHRIKFIKN